MAYKRRVRLPDSAPPEPRRSYQIHPTLRVGGLWIAGCALFYALMSGRLPTDARTKLDSSVAAAMTASPTATASPLPPQLGRPPSQTVAANEPVADSDLATPEAPREPNDLEQDVVADTAPPAPAEPNEPPPAPSDTPLLAEPAPFEPPAAAPPASAAPSTERPSSVAVSTGQSCEGAIANYSEQVRIGGPSQPPDLSREQFAARLERGDYFSHCGAPDSVTIRICAAVQNGRAVGVTVSTSPRAPGVAACVDRAVRGLSFPSHPRLDVTRTVFAAE